MPLMFLLLALSCNSAVGIAADKPLGESQRELTIVFVASREWRLFSEVFPALPAEGYPIRLNANGSVETKNLSGAVQWGINAAGEFELRAEHGSTLLRFYWYPDSGLMVSCPERTNFALPMVLALAGATYLSVVEDLRKLGVYRCHGEKAS